nr:DNA-directed DNA polymerase [Tanacetum cinerariifolium]
MKAVTTRSGLAYEGPSIPINSPLEKIVERDTEETTDKEHSNCQGSTAHIQPPVVPISIPEPDVPKTQPKPNIPYPSRLNDQKLREKATNQMEKFFQIFHDLHFDISFTDALLLMPKFASTIKSLLMNKDKIDVCHALADLGASINLMPLSIWKKLSLPELTPTRMTLELADRSITRPKGVAEEVFVKVGKFLFPTDFVVVDFEADPRVPLFLRRSFLWTGRALIDVYGEEITLKVNDESVTFNLNQTMRYSSTYDDNSVNRVDIIDIAYEEFVQDVLDFFRIENSFYDPEGDILYLEKLLNDDPFQLPPMDLKQVEETKKISDIKGIDPRFYTHKILMEEDYKPAVQSQRWVNPKIHDVIKKEVIKLLDAKMIYPISDSPWVSPIHCVPKKGGMIIVANKNNELIPTRLVTGWRVYIDYRKLNDATRQDHFSLPFMDQMLERLARNEFYCFLDRFLGYFQILIDPQDQEKATFTCPYRTFAYRRMPFGLCNAPGTFERIEVDRAKVNVIAKFPLPATVKGVRSFLGHAGFYRRFIQDFSKIARPITHLLEKETSFVFSKECVNAFDTLKKKLTEASILVVPDWNLPFELICDASDFTIGAVLGQRKTKHFQPIHYASKRMTGAQIHYTTTEKEMLAVVYAFEKFRPYLGLSKSIVYTEHSALKYLLSKQDAKPRLLWWVLLLQEFDIIIRDKKGSENLAADHLSRLENPHKDVLENKDFNENFPLETLGSLSSGNKLDDALWAFRTAFKTPIGCTPYKLVYRKSCHLPIELDHKAYWALKHVNFNLKTAGDHRKLQLNEINELHDQAYENSLIYKERTKKLHDSKIKTNIFNVGDQLLLFNSRLKIFSGKLKTCWSGPFTITQVFSYGTVELSQSDGPNFKYGIGYLRYDRIYLLPLFSHSLNATAGGNLLSKTTREALNIIENKSKVRYSRNKLNASRMNMTSRENVSKSDDRIDQLADQISTLVEIFALKVVTPALVKAVEKSCVTCSGAHAYYNCPNTDCNQPSVCAATGTYNQVA